MSKLQDTMRAGKVYNDYEFFGDQPYIACHAREARMVIPSSWSVHKKDLDLGEHWFDHGARAFSYYNRESKKEAFEAAKQWAGKKFGITKWKRGPFGGYGDEGFVKQRIKEIKNGQREA